MTHVEKGYEEQEENAYKYAYRKEVQGKLELFITEGGYGIDDTKMAESMNLFVGSSFKRKIEANMAY